MSLELSVFNPSHYPRAGYVSLPWRSICEQIEGMRPDICRLHDASGNILPFQVDPIDPSNPAKSTLTFSLVKPIERGPDDYSAASASVLVEKGDADVQENGWPSIQKEYEEDGTTIRWVILKNNRLEICFSLIPRLSNALPECYAGCITSAVLDHKEMLDRFVAEFITLGHDPEKRCMQIDRIQLSYPPWESATHQDVSMFDRPYELVSLSNGPVRATVTVASEEFCYDYLDPFAERGRRLKCRLYRVISLYAGANYVVEDVYVEGKPQDSRVSIKPINLCFSARYFAYMDLGLLEPEICQFPDIPDWFAIGCSQVSPYPAYGFACDVHASQLSYPHPGFPGGTDKKSDRTFSWWLLPAKTAKCLHFFLHHQRGGFDSQAGIQWYHHIYKPLLARIQERR